jgi:hypothetical protein
MNTEEKSVVQEVRESNYNPFSQNVKERDYTKVQASVSAEDLSQPIPEPKFAAQVIGRSRNPYETLSGSDGTRPSSSSSQSESINPSMNELSPQEKRMAAEQLVDLGLQGYEMLFYFVNKSLQVDKKKLKKLVAEGKIDPNTLIPMNNGVISAEQFIAEYNEEVADTISVSNKFKKDIKPPLTRILEKKGLGATDEQLVVSIVVMHLVQEGTKFAQAYQLKKDMLDIIADRTQMEREQGVDTSVYTKHDKPKTAPESKASRPRPADPVFTGEEEPNAEDFNFRSNEAVMNANVRKMEVPNTGKARLMEQRKKEKIFEANAKKANSTTYEAAMAKRKSTGKRGRPKKTIINSQDIAEAIIIKESTND